MLTASVICKEQRESFVRSVNSVNSVNSVKFKGYMVSMIMEKDDDIVMIIEGLEAVVNCKLLCEHRERQNGGYAPM